MAMNASEPGEHIMGMQQQLFGWLDYSVFMLMLAVSTGVGIYFGCFGNKQKAKEDYLLGGKSMTVFPVAVSLVTSLISGISIMGTPAEVYLNGSTFWFSCLGFALASIIYNFVFLPMFFGLQLTSAFEYLEMRFNKKIRKLASLLNTINLLLYISIVVYVPALAFSSVSGISVHIISPLVCIICIAYTMLGGLKAVIWTDFLQGFLIVASCVIVITIGVIKVGGLGVLWERGVQGKRIQAPSFNPSPLNRNTFWSATIGTTFFWLSATATCQGILVKFLSLPTLREARWALLWVVLGIGMLHSFGIFSGFLVYAAYYDCDPLQTKAIQRPDQILPFFVMDITSTIPILPGVFVAGIFSASLSSLSSCLNALSGTVYEDFIRPHFDRDSLSEGTVNIIMKTIVVVAGTLCVLLVFVVEQLGTVMELNLTVGAVCAGALVGIFSLGALVPRANAQGAIVGGLCGMIVVAWLVTGSQVAMKSGSIVRKSLPTSVDGCGINISVTPTSVPSQPSEPAFLLYRISFYYYYLIGAIVVMIIGTAVSVFTDPPHPATIKPSLFAPFLHDYIVRKKRETAVQPVELQMLSSDKTN